MKRVLRVILLSAAAVAVAAGAWFAFENGSEQVALPSVSDVRVEPSLAARRHRFGDSLSARVDVLVSNQRVDPRSVRLDAPTAPFEVVGPIRVERLQAARTTRVRFEVDLRCLARACVPIADTPLRLPDGVVRFWREDGTAGRLRLEWPTLPSRSRLGSLQDDLLAWQDGVRPLPERDYRVPPRVLAGAAAALALLAALMAGRLLGPLLVPLVPRPRATDRRTLLERALAAVRRAASTADTDERRRALDLLARELRAGARGREARLARRLAWSRHEPRSGEMQRLVDVVERGPA